MRRPRRGIASGTGRLFDPPPALHPDSAFSGAFTAYTDGSCFPNPGPGGWGAVLLDAGKIVAKRSGSSGGATTNNRMELTAIMQALLLAPKGRPVEIATDSKLCIGWLSKGWKRNLPEIDALCRLIEPLLRARPVRFRWVEAHAGARGDPFNELADHLAVEASRGKTIDVAVCSDEIESCSLPV